MNEDFVSFDLAKKLKKKGFPQYTEKSYFVGDHKKRMCSVGTFLHVHTQNTEHLVAAPTISQVLKWLREVKNLCVEVHISMRGGWYNIIYEIAPRRGFDLKHMLIEKKSYEEAAIADIEYVIDNLI